MTDVERLERMIEELRSLRNKCEPKTRENPRYHAYSRAVSALREIIADLTAEESG